MANGEHPTLGQLYQWCNFITLSVTDGQTQGNRAGLWLVQPKMEGITGRKEISLEQMLCIQNRPDS